MMVGDIIVPKNRKWVRTMRKEWVLLCPKSDAVKRLVDFLGLDPFIAGLLVNRGITDEDDALRFLNPDRNSLHDPFLMKDMEKAVRRVLDAREREESIMIFGDYDVDGVTSTALLYMAMRRMGFRVSCYIPLRLEEGYGLSKDALKDFKAQGHDLLITVDCGVTSFDEISYAKEIGLGVVVTDHHEVKDQLPLADAIINPKRPDDPYPFRGLAGVGVAYKLLLALNETLGCPIDPEEYLDIVALGTIADIVPLIDENRFIVKEGTSKIKKTPSLGLKALLNYLRISTETLTAQDIAFKIAPKLNAAGRMDSALVALELLISEDVSDAMKTASRLLQHNQNRQTIEAKIFDQAFREIESSPSLKEDQVLVLSGDNWHLGVLGIVASRLSSMYSKPAFLVSTSGAEGKGSARSPSGLSVISLLNDVSDLLREFGGHELAAGFSIERDRISEFRKRINEAYINNYGHELPIQQILIDGEVSLEALNKDTLDMLNTLSPFGHSNPEPTFLIRSLNIEKAKPFGNNGDHIKLVLRSGDRKTLAIGFNMNGVFDEYKYVKPSLLKIDAVVSIKNDSGYGLEGTKLSMTDARLSIDPVFEEEVREKNFVHEFIRNWKNQQPGDENRPDVTTMLSELEKRLFHRGAESPGQLEKNPFGVFGNMRIKNTFLAWKILRNFQQGKRTIVVSAVNGTLAHTYHSLRHYIDEVKPVYSNSLYRGELEENVVFSTLPFFNDNLGELYDKATDIIFDEPGYILSGIYKGLPDFDRFFEVAPKILSKSIFVGSNFTPEVKDFMSTLGVKYLYKPLQIRKVGIIDNRGTRKKVDQVLSLIRHDENVAVVVDSPQKTVSLAKYLGTRLANALQNGELIFYNHMLKEFQRSAIYSLIEKQRIRVLVTTPSNDGLGVMLGNSNIVFYSAPRNFLEIQDAVTTRPGEETELFLNLAFNRSDLQSNTSEIDRLFPTLEELEVIYQDVRDVLPASEKDLKKALSIENGMDRVYLSVLEDLDLVAHDGSEWYLVNGRGMEKDAARQTLRYREGLAEKRTSRWFASKLSTMTTRSLLRSLTDCCEVLRVG